MNESGLTWRHAAGVGAVVLLVCYGLLRWTTGQGHGLPQMSWFILVTLVLLSFAVLAAGWDVRSYLSGTSTRPPSPMKARRALVASQAWVLAGSMFAGWFGAFALVEAGRLDAGSAHGAMIQGIVLFAGSIGAVVVGLVVQSWCRVPKDKDDDDAPGNGTLRA